MTRRQRFGQGDAWLREYVKEISAREIDKLVGSAVMVGVWDDSDWDTARLMFATQVGIMLLLGKPLVLCVEPGGTVPPGLARACEAVITDYDGSPLKKDELAGVVVALREKLDGPAP